MNSQSRRPVAQMLEHFAESSPVSFHVPGHKNGKLTGLPEAVRGMMSWDVTELPGLDDLHAPEGPIREAQELLADAYGSYRSFFLINGTTAGNLAMILASCRPGDRIIVQRNAHKSVFHGLVLAGTRPVYVDPVWDPATQSPGHAEAALIREAVRMYPEAKAVILTNPTYYGTVSPHLREIADICQNAGMPLLVDEAHGAHFGIGAPFPEPSLSRGADVVVQSAHKTLPAMTMASFLHVAHGSLLEAERISHYLGMLQSSSPSYPLMASLDDARHYIATYTEEDLQVFLSFHEAMVGEMSAIDGLSVIQPDDPLKLILRAEGHSGNALSEALAREGVHSELSDPYQALLVLPLLKRSQDDLLREVLAATRRAVGSLGSGMETGEPAVPVTQPAITAADGPPDLQPGESAEWIDYHKSEGRLSAASVIPYPPGIPLLLPGEPVTGEKIRILHNYLSAGTVFQGTHRLGTQQILVSRQSPEA
ncbi:Arginine decarboxylase [Bhargavaea cecembensis DSE10]|uniref:Arginine decarboxylase n=1 Tax=Bhargavaea cecembensis DSE10 TaxID=1235279 RepID=M7ND24_9BACL|nr:aminotransferase class I/II-fold pyridoxal phosphate-dependent enzyme [Bhargavaea cecembensis]EMR05081.1 Arginine decarboxylase [Bhargavaea cecembensis DSE10]